MKTVVAGPHSFATKNPDWKFVDADAAKVKVAIAQCHPEDVELATDSEILIEQSVRFNVKQITTISRIFTAYECLLLVTEGFVLNEREDTAVRV